MTVTEAPPAIAAPSRPGGAPSVIVWATWAVMLAVVLAYIGRDAHDIPLAEDWNMVPALTGHQDNLPAWLWEQNNEHRLPLPRLILLALLKVSGGDFRAGMVFNTLALAALAAAMILVARSLRGRTSVTDAVFPLALLHLGHWENLVWSWQIQFVVSALVVCILLLVLVGRRGPLSTRAAAVGAACLVLLPLTGASGLVFVPFGAAALVARSLPGWHRPRPAAAIIVLAGSAAAFLISGAYFIGYEQVTWNPDNPGAGPTVRTSAKFLAMQAGPGAERSWSLSTLLAVGALASAIAVVVRTLRRQGDPERSTALAVAAFLAGMAALAGAVGWGRAAYVPTTGLPDRYAVLAVPLLCCIYLAWVRLGPPPLASWAQAGLLATMVVLLPVNVAEGHRWRDWYTTGMESVERDIDAGASRDEMVARHGDFLLHWDDDKLARRIDLLREKGIGPFAREPR